MPKFENIKKVLVVGSGGIVIAQAAEFDYSGSQCLKALREEGIETVLVNPNIATIQTSPRMADKIYLEPCVPNVIERIIHREKPDGIMLGFGGQTALNAGVQLNETGVFQREGVKVLGSSIKAINITEDRLLFKKMMENVGVPIPASNAAYNKSEALEIAEDIGYPVIVRTAYMLGGGGSGVAYSRAELTEIVDRAFEWSIEHQVLIEQYLHHWKEIEYEVVRDYDDNTITVAALENFDPLGIHTGDSVVIAPTQTLTNQEYQMLRDASMRVIRGVEIVGECNIQFGLHPYSKDYVAIEVNPRMSRSSALASKATGYPLAYIAAKLAIGYSLPELVNKVTEVTTACFEPSLDYVVVKVPRWDFEKFPGNIDRHIGSMMKSVGEVMSIARTFEEALQKSIRELDIGKIGLVGNPGDLIDEPLDKLRDELENPTDQRLYKIAKAIRQRMPLELINRLTGIDLWYLYKIRNIVEMNEFLRKLSHNHNDVNLIDVIRRAKELGFSDKQIANCLQVEEKSIRQYRKSKQILPSFKIVDTLAAEWESKTNYCYATYGGSEDDLDFTESKSKVVVLGAGCIRIGSSVEFDYCTMNTAWALKEEGIEEVIVVNNNPETVSTDFDMSDKLYFEEITLERVLDIVDKEKPIGVVVSVGGQTPNNLALQLHQMGIPIIGTSARSIDIAEDRFKFSKLLDRLGIRQPRWSSLTSLEDIKAFSNQIGYPVLTRPSYVLSGSAMRVANNVSELEDWVKLATMISPEHPVVVSKFIHGAREVEIDAVSDGYNVLEGAIIEHIELAGTHSGDATMVIPPQTLSSNVIFKIRNYTNRIAKALNIKGVFNIQFLVKDGTVYVIECNLRSSRSMPYSSKASGVPLVWFGAKVMLGKSLTELGLFRTSNPQYVAVKTPVFSFMRLKGADPLLGVEMTSTGEVACFDYDLSGALIKTMISSNLRLPDPNKPVLITVKEEDKEVATNIAKKLVKMGHNIIATKGTAEALINKGIPNVKILKKVHEEGIGEDILDYLTEQKIGFIINTPTSTSRKTLDDEYVIRKMASEFLIPVATRIETAKAIVDALERRGYHSIMRPISLNEVLEGLPYGKYV